MNNLSNQTKGNKVEIGIIEPTIEIKNKVGYKKKSNPAGKIRLAYDSKDYSQVVSLSCTFFQFFGKKILRWHSKKSKKPISKAKLERLEPILSELYERGLIDKNTHNKINGIKKGEKIIRKGVRNFRNVYQHDKRAFIYSSSQAKKDKVLAELALKHAEKLYKEYEFLW